MRGIIAVLMVGGAVAVVALGANPLWQDIVRLRAEKGEFSSTIARINDLRAVRDALIGTYNSISQTDIKRVKKILPDALSSGPTLLELANMASDSGRLLQSIDVSSESNRPGSPVVKDASRRYNEIGLKLVVSGPYERFRTFLQKLEKDLHLIDVTSVSFVSAVRLDTSVDFFIEAKSYQQP